MMLLTVFWSAEPAAILSARRRPMPLTSRRREGSVSITSKVSRPNRATMRWASLGPMPPIMPEPR